MFFTNMSVGHKCTVAAARAAASERAGRRAPARGASPSLGADLCSCCRPRRPLSSSEQMDGLLAAASKASEAATAAATQASSQAVAATRGTIGVAACE